MRLVTLNVWGGKLFEPLLSYIKEQAVEIDVLCLQEVFDTASAVRESHEWRANLFAELTHALPIHHGYFAPAQDGFDLTGPVDFPISYGSAIFVRHTVDVRATQDVFVHLDRNGQTNQNGWPDFPRVLQVFHLTNADGKAFSVLNFHGCYPKPGEVDDGPERQEQSKRVRQVMNEIQGPKILCGDFNLLPESVSMQILEEEMRNATREGFIETTRTPQYQGTNVRPDNIIVSKDLAVLSVAVPEVVVSDHYPVILDFAL